MACRARTIVFLAQGFSEPGGCASHGRKIVEGLADRGWNVRVIARLGSGRKLRRLRAPGITVTEIPGFGQRGFGGLMFLLAALPMALLRRPPRAFMAMQLASTTTVASMAAVLRRRPLVVFSTSTGEHGEVAFVRGSRVAWVRRALINQAAILIAQSEEGAHELRALLAESRNGRVAVVPTPVRVPHAIPPLAGNLVAAYSGRLVAGKNLDRLLVAWSRLNGMLPEARLLLIGGGWTGDPIEEQLRELVTADKTLSQSVMFSGWVSDVHRYLLMADVYVFPSASEGMSNSLLEACSLGRVVVASNIASNREVLGEHYPLLIDPNDSFAFATALAKGLSDAAVRLEARCRILHRLHRFESQSVLDRIEAMLEA